MITIFIRIALEGKKYYIDSDLHGFFYESSFFELFSNLLYTEKSARNFDLLKNSRRYESVNVSKYVKATLGTKYIKVH